MNYHNITTDDMKNGDGLRTVLWVAGCTHHCIGCHNPITHDVNGGLPFDNCAKEELFEKLDHDYISGLTISGGDPLIPQNISSTLKLVKEVRSKFPHKTIWIYTGFIWDDLVWLELFMEISKYIDVLVDGPYILALADVKYPWAGSTNQRVIDVQRTLMNKTGRIYLHETV